MTKDVYQNWHLVMFLLQIKLLIVRSDIHLNHLFAFYFVSTCIMIPQIKKKRYFLSLFLYHLAQLPNRLHGFN